MWINCDLGEVDDVRRCDKEQKIMPFIHGANIACGGHSGSEEVMKFCVRLAKEHGVKLGAHPSYPDRKNFGRSPCSLSLRQLEQSLVEQVELLEKQAGKLDYIKPHGALYHDILFDEMKRHLILRLVERSSASSLMICATPNKREKVLQEARAFGVELIFEVFCDRAYTNDGILLGRQNKGAVFTTEEKILQQARDLLRGRVKTHTGKELICQAQSICLHSDNQASVKVASKLKRLLDDY